MAMTVENMVKHMLIMKNQDFYNKICDIADTVCIELTKKQQSGKGFAFPVELQFVNTPKDFGDLYTGYPKSVTANYIEYKGNRLDLDTLVGYEFAVYITFLKDLKQSINTNLKKVDKKLKKAIMEDIQKSIDMYNWDYSLKASEILGFVTHQEALENAKNYQNTVKQIKHNITKDIHKDKNLSTKFMVYELALMQYETYQ